MQRANDIIVFAHGRSAVACTSIIHVRRLTSVLTILHNSMCDHDFVLRVCIIIRPVLTYVSETSRRLQNLLLQCVIGFASLHLGQRLAELGLVRMLLHPEHRLTPWGTGVETGDTPVPSALRWSDQR